MHASKARQYFERAVALDPANEEAMNDLFDYYLQAPGFLGGGFERAEQVAKRIEESVRAELEEAVQFALASPFPAPEEAMKHVFA